MAIPVPRRIGLLDRKMRVVNENVTSEKDWCLMAEKAFKHTYGYEWQGDSLLLAREALLLTYIEYYVDKFNEKDENGVYIRNSDGQLNVPATNSLINAARWISWNLWQMDGIKLVVPGSCHETVIQPYVQGDLFAAAPMEPPRPIVQPCPGCTEGNVYKHNGDYCLIRDWSRPKPRDWRPSAGEDPHSQPWQNMEFKSLLYFNDQNNESDGEE